jgi:hypothetical protein
MHHRRRVRLLHLSQQEGSRDHQRRKQRVAEEHVDIGQQRSLLLDDPVDRPEQERQTDAMFAKAKCELVHTLSGPDVIRFASATVAGIHGRPEALSNPHWAELLLSRPGLFPWMRN